MKDYNNFKSWKSSHSTLMQNLSFSAPDDLFIYTNFKMTTPVEIEERQLLFAESMAEAAGYFRHIFLYDLLVDATNDLELDDVLKAEERQKDVLFLLFLWFKAGKVLQMSDVKNSLLNLINEFNNQFNDHNQLNYEFQILNGVNELKEFLKSKFKDKENFDEKQLDIVCNKQLFVGKLLNDFIMTLFKE